MKLREFLTDDRWCQGCYARDIDGNEVFFYDESAHSFSLLGALWHLYDDPAERMKCQDRLASLVRVLHNKRIEEFNDIAEWSDINRIILTINC